MASRRAWLEVLALNLIGIGAIMAGAGLGVLLWLAFR